MSDRFDTIATALINKYPSDERYRLRNAIIDVLREERDAALDEAADLVNGIEVNIYCTGKIFDPSLGDDRIIHESKQSFYMGDKIRALKSGAK